jgi:hypothetical protein
MIMYCIDKSHPLYGRRIRIHKSGKEGSEPVYVDVLSNVPVDLKPEQVSLYPADDKSEGGKN